MSENPLKFFEERFKVEATKPNLWSYLVLNGTYLMIKKGHKKDIDSEKRGLILEAVKKAKSGRDGIERAKKLLKMMERGFKGSGYRVMRVRAVTKSRLAIGLSSPIGQLPFELGISFDPYFNLPYIPGSSIKGAVRMAFHDLFISGKGEQEKRKYGEMEDRIFGKSGKMGLVGFTDAYPVGFKEHLLHPDIINPHYKEKDDELNVSPTPLPFLTVAPGTEFQFFVYFEKPGMKRNGLTLEERGLFSRALIFAFLRGVGAKTSVGYSNFDLNFELKEFMEVEG